MKLVGWAAIFAIIAIIALLLWTGPANADTGAVSVNTARTMYVKAHRSAIQAEKRTREAQQAYRATKEVTALYSRDGFWPADGVRIGRWVHLLRESGFRWSQVGQAIAVIARESRGADKAKNTSSTASGLCQWLAFWWDGSGDFGWSFDPFDARVSVHYFERVVNHTYLGWSPWNPVPAVRWWASW